MQRVGAAVRPARVTSSSAAGRPSAASLRERAAVHRADLDLDTIRHAQHVERDPRHLGDPCLGSEDRMKWLTPPLRGGIRCPTRVTRGQRRKKRGASHGPYWHRRAQEGKPDLHPGRGGRAERAAHPHRPPSGSPPSSATARGPASSSRPRPRASGWRAVWKGSATRSSSPTRTSRPMYATRTRKIKTDRRDARALAEACRLGAYRPAHRLSDAQRHVAGPPDGARRPGAHPHPYITVIRALLRQHGWRVPSGSAELSLRPQRGCGVRGWGRDGLGTGARGRGARPRRVLMLPSLPGPAARTLDPGDLPLQGPARLNKRQIAFEGLGERGRRSGPARPRPRLMPLVTALPGSRTPFPLPRVA